MELWSLQNVSTHRLYQRLLSRYDMIPISTGYVKGYEKIKINTGQHILVLHWKLQHGQFIFLSLPLLSSKDTRGSEIS